jgi:DNA-directed RNA polymerase specialized sigma subunit
MSKFTFDPHFRFFSKEVQLNVADSFGVSKDEFTKKQKEQVELLISLEKKFKKTLLADSRGVNIYKKFLDFIWHSGKDNRRNTLVARPFFRERRTQFSKGISPAIKKKDLKKLIKFNINFPFIVFVMDVGNFGPNSKITKLAKEVELARNVIIHQNMPLAISRARIFKQKTPQAHLSYMDLVQISLEALCTAVDKFVPPYTTVFRDVIIGRITGDLIDNYSDKMLYFYPSDKRKIYRANKVLKNQKNDDMESLAKKVNEGPALDQPTTGPEINQLMMASSHFSLDEGFNSEDPGEMHVKDTSYHNICAADEESRPDIMAEQKDLKTKLVSCLHNLSILENKLLRLKGVNEDMI